MPKLMSINPSKITHENVNVPTQHYLLGMLINRAMCQYFIISTSYVKEVTYIVLIKVNPVSYELTKNIMKCWYNKLAANNYLGTSDI